jgi:hypothetical protein
MLKHGVATQSEVAYAETRSCYIVRGRICRNTELLHSSRRQMLKHGAVTQFRITDAETQEETARINDAETQAVTVSGQGRHSQERNSRG